MPRIRNLQLTREKLKRDMNEESASICERGSTTEYFIGSYPTLLINYRRRLQDSVVHHNLNQPGGILLLLVSEY